MSGTFPPGHPVYKSSVFQLDNSSRHLQQNFEPQGVQKHNDRENKDVPIHDMKSHNQWRLVLLTINPYQHFCSRMVTGK